MATNPLTYSKSTDFGGSFSSKNFAASIRLPANGVERSLDHITTDGDTIKVYFVGAGDIAQADVDKIQGASYPSPIGGLIAAHDPTPQDEPAQKVKLDKAERQIVELNEIENGDKYYRNYAFPILEMAVSDDEKEVFLQLPFDFWFLSVEFFAGPGSGAQLKDTISALVDPDLNAEDACIALGLPAGTGKTQSAIAIDDDWVDVSPYIMGNENLIEALFRIGTIIKFDSTSGTEYTIGALDRDNSKIRIYTYNHTTREYSSGATEAYSSGVVIYRTIVAGDHINVIPTYDGNQYGSTKIGSSKLPAGKKFVVRYCKPTADTGSRIISINIEGMVGDRPSE